MRYAYYPGCSLHATSRAYQESIEAIAGPLDLELQEIPDWNCCGATAYMNIDEGVAHTLSARNLALAAQQSDTVVAPCSACFTNLNKTNAYLEEFPGLRQEVDSALAEGGLEYRGGVRVRHLLDVIVDDIGLDQVRQQVARPLKGLRVAPYYGCQIVRPRGAAPNPDLPRNLEVLLEALGAEPVEYPLRLTCCGGALMGTREEVALRLCRNLMLCAEQFGADLVAVTCPLCQINLDLYQPRINRVYGTRFHVPILFFTQLMGMAFGMDARTLGLERGVTPLNARVSQYA